MGTRSITTIVDNGRKIVTMYRQFDGYPSGHGEELFDFLAPMKLCNGIGTQQSTGKWANGAGCLAAQMIAHFKTGIGGIYLETPRLKLAGEDFGYEVHVDEHNDIKVKVNDRRNTLFYGSVPDFGKFCEGN